MSEDTKTGKGGNGASRENIGYVRQMLAEMANVARRERADLLVYLLEMAYTEASDLLMAQSDGDRVQGHHAARMAVKPTGKI
jgi:hypothetical protein